MVLEEVLRKRPGWLVRIFGLGFYGAVCLFPFVLFAALVGLMATGLLSGSTGREERLTEMRADLPEARDELTAVKSAPISELSATTWELLDAIGDSSPGRERARVLAGSFPAEASREVDLLRWEDVGAFQRLNGSSLETVDVWLENACLRMERATEAGKHDEAFRRSEIMLYAIRSLEPALSYNQRAQLWDVQVRVLKNLGTLIGSGALTPAMRDRLKPRIQALRGLPDPAVEAFLLVDGWTEREFQELIEGNAEEPAPDDEAFCRTFYRQIDEFRGGRNGPPPTSVAVGRLWKSTGKAGELPAESPAGVQATPAEADFLHQFCDRQRELCWLQNATLCALDFDAYLAQHRRYPPRWDRPVPGGGKLELVPGPAPRLRLADARDEAQRAGPAWLGRTPDQARPPLDFPLRPAADPAGG
jgi:hypothetical protein